MIAKIAYNNKILAQPRMFAMESIIIAVIAFVIGLIAGVFIHRQSHTNTEGSEKKEVEKLRQEFSEYQQQVGTHINKTAQLIDDMQSHYQMIQEHVFTSGQALNRVVDTKSLFKSEQDAAYADPAIKAAQAKQDSQSQ